MRKRPKRKEVKNMDSKQKKFIRYEDKLWFVDFTGWETGKGDAVIDIINPDGTSYPASPKDGALMDVLNEGLIVPQPARYIPRKSSDR